MHSPTFSRKTVEEAFAADGVFHLRASGFSMLPSIQPGSLLLISPLPGPPRPGDVVLAHPSDTLWLCHRVLRIMPDGGIITKGDGNPGADAPIQQHHIVGHVTAMYRPDGCYVDFSRAPQRVLAALIVPLETRLPGTLRTVGHCVRSGRRLARPWYNRVRRWLP